MAEELISIADVAQSCGKRKQTVFKILKRLGIEPEKCKSSEKHGQTASYITKSEFEAVATQIATDRDFSQLSPGVVPSESGYFYLIQLEPDHDPGRFKVGFTVNVEERLRAHRCAAPLLKLRKIWPCRSLWEKTAIDCVCDGVEQLHTEVFRADDLEKIEIKCDEFFFLMPKFIEEN